MRASQQEMSMQRRDFVVLTSGSLIAPALLSSATAATGMRVTAAEFGAARRFVDTRFGRIAHVDRGRGDAVLFLHGLPLNGFQWRDSIAMLSSDRRCLAPDFLGLGYTEVAAGQSVGPLDQMAMLIAFLDATDVRKVDVIASDSGGAVAQHLVTRHPERVRSLLLANCDTEIDYPVAALQVSFELSRQGQFADGVVGAWQADKALARSDEKGLGACYADATRLPDEVFDEYLLPLLASAQKKAKLHEYVLALEANPLAGIESALGKCRVPTRIVWGADDRVFSTQSPGYLAKAFGNSKGLRMLEGSKLFWPEERPEIVVEEARMLWGA
jgi:pimeloyl-ACP methyl ester carboxylesterase